ncbi:MAG: hypothetical protein ACPLN1_07275 [Caldisericia bacterium]
MELFFTDKAKIEKLYRFDVDDVEGLWEAEEPISYASGNFWFRAKKVGENEWANWNIYLDLKVIPLEILEELEHAKYADILFSLPWESWVVVQ